MSLIDSMYKIGKKIESTKNWPKSPTYWKIIFTIFVLKILVYWMMHLGWLT